jgi:hypothetical protein
LLVFALCLVFPGKTEEATKKGQSTDTGNTGKTRHKAKTSKTEEATKKGQSTDTGNTGKTRHKAKTSKTKTTTIIMKTNKHTKHHRELKI